MSYAAAAIRQAVTDVLNGARGVTRVVAAGNMLAGVHEGQTATQRKALALHGATHRYDVELTRLRSHEASPAGGTSNYRLARLNIAITVTTAAKAVIREDARGTVLAAIMSDLETAAQALAYPGNLEFTAALVPTGIVSGLLSGPDGEGRFPECDIVSQDWAHQLITSRITASCVVNIAQAV